MKERMYTMMMMNLTRWREREKEMYMSNECFFSCSNGERQNKRILNNTYGDRCIMLLLSHFFFSCLFIRCFWTMN